MSTPIFPLLLGPLTEREKLFFDGTLHKSEDLEFVEGLLQVLENDLAQGHVPTAEQTQQWAEFLTMELHPPRMEARMPVKATNDLPAPGQPWIKTQSDPRERLLARLVHLGADPWRFIERKGNGMHKAAPGSDDYRARLLGQSLAATWLAYGYFDLVRLAFSMPHDPKRYLDLGPRRSFEEGDLTVIQQAAIRDQVDLLNTMVEAGTSVDGVLMHAQSVGAVELLFKHGAGLDEGKVIEHWLKKHDAKTTRALIKATEEHMTPQARVLQALNGKAWGPVNDALEAWPEWHQARFELGEATLPLGLHALASSERSSLHKLQHALRILAKQPPTDQEAFPGLSEKALARLVLYTLASPVKSNGCNPTKEELALRQKLLAAVQVLGGDTQTLQNDAIAFVKAADPLHDTECARHIAAVALGKGLLLPKETSHTRMVFSNRSVDDMILMGQAARCIWTSKYIRADDDWFSKLFCAEPMDIARQGYGGPSGNDPRRTWFPQMLARHPEHTQALGTAAVHLLGAGLSRKVNATHEDPWGTLCLQLEEAMEQGALDALPRRDGLKLREVAQSNGRSAMAISLGTRLDALLQQMTLDAATPDAQATTPRRRF